MSGAMMNLLTNTEELRCSRNIHAGSPRNWRENTALHCGVAGEKLLALMTG
jgi:hypothetical protein